MENILEFNCPHCSGKIQVLQSEINCAIFRHGILKSTYEQIPPHATKEECDNLFNENAIYGCGKPFQLYLNENIWNIKICDYI